jgi:hypothetical protein
MARKITQWDPDSLSTVETERLYDEFTIAATQRDPGNYGLGHTHERTLTFYVDEQTGTMTTYPLMFERQILKETK